jgi:hypothetical protein
MSSILRQVLTPLFAPCLCPLQSMAISMVQQLLLPRMERVLSAVKVRSGNHMTAELLVLYTAGIGVCW